MTIESRESWLLAVMAVLQGAATARTAVAEEPPSVQAPDPSGAIDARNAVYVELLGSGGLYSINYDRWIEDKFNLRIGISYIRLEASSSTESGSVSLVTFPLMGGVCLGGETHKLELSVGTLIVYLSASVSSGTQDYLSGTGIGAAGTAFIGYRRQRPEGGFLFRAGFTPLFGAGGFLPWGGLSLGASF